MRPHTTRTRFAEILRENRIANGLTQTQLAAATGVTQRAISMWEAGKRDPQAYGLARLAKYFGTEMDCLYKGC